MSVECDVPRPRNIDRPYRDMRDEPAEQVQLLRRLRQAVYCGSEDLTRCSYCTQPVTARTPPGTPAPLRKPAHAAFMMSPGRVFRDLVATDPACPLRPDLRDALVDTISCRFEYLARRAALLSGDDPAAPRAATATTFPRFLDLPYELRHMIWLRALPPRVLLWKDLFRSRWYGCVEGTRPDDGAHTLHQLWRSDLFYVCRESRRVVEAYEGGGGGAPCPTLGISSLHKLARGYDELYYPWKGSKGRLAARAPWNFGSRSLRDPANEFLAPVLAADAADFCWPAQLQDRDLRMPAVALDVGWIDSGDMHVLAWIGGCYDGPRKTEEARARERAPELAKCDAPQVEEEEDLPEFLLANRSLMVSPSAAALQRLDVVVADILVPVALRLDRCTAQQHMLLVQDMARQFTTGDTGPVPAVAGRDFTVLVDLYDDWRIDEILSLMAPLPADAAAVGKPRYGNRGLCGEDGLAGRVVNKSAAHPCIGCTRALWEARSWRSFGERLGPRLAQLCRPVIVFSVIVEFADDEIMQDRPGQGERNSWGNYEGRQAV